MTKNKPEPAAPSRVMIRRAVFICHHVLAISFVASLWAVRGDDPTVVSYGDLINWWTMVSLASFNLLLMSWQFIAQEVRRGRILWGEWAKMQTFVAFVIALLMMSWVLDTSRGWAILMTIAVMTLLTLILAGSLNLAGYGRFRPPPPPPGL